MKNIPVEKLAKDGGPKAVRHKIPYVMQGPNEIGVEERRNLLTVLKRKALFRFANKPEDSFVARFEKEFAIKMCDFGDFGDGYSDCSNCSQNMI